MIYGLAITLTLFYWKFDIGKKYYHIKHFFLQTIAAGYKSDLEIRTGIYEMYLYVLICYHNLNLKLHVANSVTEL